MSLVPTVYISKWHIGFNRKLGSLEYDIGDMGKSELLWAGWGRDSEFPNNKTEQKQIFIMLLES